MTPAHISSLIVTTELRAQRVGPRAVRLGSVVTSGRRAAREDAHRAARGR